MPSLLLICSAISEYLRCAWLEIKLSRYGFVYMLFMLLWCSSTVGLLSDLSSSVEGTGLPPPILVNPSFLFPAFITEPKLFISSIYCPAIVWTDNCSLLVLGKLSTNLFTPSLSRSPVLLLLTLYTCWRFSMFLGTFTNFLW